MHRTPTTTGYLATPRSTSRRQPWLWFHILSLDAPLVAVLWQGFFAKLLHADVRWPAFIALGTAVWLIYVADRILDASAETARHEFYKENWRRLRGIVVVASAALAFACRFLNRAVLRNGVILGMLVVVYLLLVHAASKRVQNWFPKELGVALIFAAGTVLATWTKLGASRGVLIAPGILFAILCWLNCVAIECWEWRRLRNMSILRPHTVTIWMGSRLPVLSFLTVVLCAALFAVHEYRLISGAGALCAVALLWLDSRRDRLSVNALRVLADVSLLTPAIFMGLR